MHVFEYIFSLYLTLWSVLLDSVLPVSHAGSAKSANISPSIIMADLIQCYLQKCKLLSAAKKARNLPDPIKQDRITTQQVCGGLRSILEAISQESFEKAIVIIQRLLNDLSKNFGQKSWESDLCYVSLLCDSISILLKAMKSQTNDRINVVGPNVAHWIQKQDGKREIEFTKILVFKIYLYL